MKLTLGMAVTKVMSMTELETAPLPGYIAVLWKLDFDERQNQGALGVDSHKVLRSRGTHNEGRVCPQWALPHTIEFWLGG